MQKKSAQTSSSSPKTYHNVLVTIPEFSFLPQNILDGEPWKLPVPVCSLGENFFTILCKEYAYFMTDDAEALAAELKKYQLSAPPAKKYTPNPSLAHTVRLKMLELGVKWSVTVLEKSIIVNYYTEEDGAFIAIADRKDA